MTLSSSYSKFFRFCSLSIHHCSTGYKQCHGEEEVPYFTVWCQFTSIILTTRATMAVPAGMDFQWLASYIVPNMGAIFHITLVLVQHWQSHGWSLLSQLFRPSQNHKSSIRRSSVGSGNPITGLFSASNARPGSLEPFPSCTCQIRQHSKLVRVPGSYTTWIHQGVTKQTSVCLLQSPRTPFVDGFQPLERSPTTPTADTCHTYSKHLPYLPTANTYTPTANAYHTYSRHLPCL